MLTRNNNFEISITNIVSSPTTWGLLLHISFFLLFYLNLLQHVVICNFTAQYQKGHKFVTANKYNDCTFAQKPACF